MNREISVFETIYLENYSKLYKLAFKITGNIHDSEDVLQDAFMNAYGAYSGFKNESSVSTWLYRITVNSAIKYIKHRKSFPVERMAHEKGVSVTDIFESLKDYRQTEDEVLYNEMRETCIHMFTECLPVKQRLTFVLRVIMNLNVDETPSVLEISNAAVKTNLYRARESMKKAMDGKCSFIDPKFPCKCKLWVNYALANDKADLIKAIPVYSRDENEVARQILGEINFLRKLTILYDSDYREVSGDVFLTNIK
ncbi:MAG TPA: RNA polymerase subunit sigma-70, partial [Clostridiales bacterium UBA8960]|nr:RNA polymerase subunit sigma-70 [Clostridiales bacterium UBA8960]